MKDRREEREAHRQYNAPYTSMKERRLHIFRVQNADLPPFIYDYPFKPCAGPGTSMAYVLLPKGLLNMVESAATDKVCAAGIPLVSLRDRAVKRGDNLTSD
jgi:hypothetical protein